MYSRGVHGLGYYLADECVSHIEGIDFVGAVDAIVDSRLTASSEL